MFLAFPSQEKTNSDSDNGFAENVGKLQMTKFSYIFNKSLGVLLKLDLIKGIKWQNKFSSVPKHAGIDTNIDKLKVNYKTLKQEQSSITDRIKIVKWTFPYKEPCCF